MSDTVITKVIKQKSDNDKMKKRDRACKICGTRKGFIRKYNMGICRRCFKDNAKRLGFEKYD
jgi:ribosomal protein S14